MILRHCVGKLTTSRKVSAMSEQSIVRRPWEFACQWYGVDEIHQTINREENLKQIGSVPAIPEDVTSREFAEWLADQYRLAMRKGAELATQEMSSGIKALLRSPEVYITLDEREGWNLARREVERFMERGE